MGTEQTLEPPEVEMPVFCKAEAVPISEKTGIKLVALARSGGTGVLEDLGA
jgi:hypothetical protein